MKTKLLTLFLAVLLVLGITSSYAAVDVGIDFNQLNLKSKVLKSLDGEKDTNIYYAIPLIVYYKDTDSSDTVTNKEALGSVDIDTDLEDRLGFSLNIELVPLNKVLKNTFGKKDGSIKIPIVDVIVDNFLQLSITGGVMHNFDTDDNEKVIGLTVIQRTF